MSDIIAELDEAVADFSEDGEIVWPGDILSEASWEIKLLRIALADAIRRPMGVIPASAEGLITDADLDAAEKRRPRT